MFNFSSTIRTIIFMSFSLMILTSCGGGDSSTTPVTTTPPTSTPPETQPPIEPKSNYSLFIQQGTVNITASPDTSNGATTLNVWGFSAVETLPAGNTIVPGTTINVEQGKAVTINIKNNLTADHNFSFVNFSANGIPKTTNLIPSGVTNSYTFTPQQSGIYLYSDSLLNGINQSLGLYGVMIVRPATSLGKVAWQGGPSFDKEVTWVIADLDYKNYNQVAINTTTTASDIITANYKPNYFLMNGMNGFQAMADPSTTIQGAIGKIVLVRIANAGQYSQSLHFHGNHFKIISRNGVRLNTNDFESVDTINIKPNQTAMVLYTIDQLGHYPMHVHTAQMETGNGVYLNGTAAMIIGK